MGRSLYNELSISKNTEVVLTGKKTKQKLASLPEPPSWLKGFCSHVSLPAEAPHSAARTKAPVHLRTPRGMWAWPGLGEPPTSPITSSPECPLGEAQSPGPCLSAPRVWNPILPHLAQGLPGRRDSDKPAPAPAVTCCARGGSPIF